MRWVIVCRVRRRVARHRLRASLASLEHAARFGQVANARARPALARRHARGTREPSARHPPDSARAPAARWRCGRSNSADRRAPADAPPPAAQAVRAQRLGDVLIQRGHAVVVETRGDRAEHRHLLGRLREVAAVALHLLRDVAQRIRRAFAVELVDRDEAGEVEHVDLFQLARRAELRRHHVQRFVDERHDRRIALPDPGRLDDDQIEARRLAQRRARRAARRRVHSTRRASPSSACRRARRAPVTDRVHADAVAEQRAAGFAARRIDGEHGDGERVAVVEAKTADQFVGERGFAGAAGAGDAEDGTSIASRGPKISARR